MEEVPGYVKFLSFLFIVIYMISVMLETTRGEILGTLKDFGLTGWALLTNVVIIPLIGLVLANVFDVLQRNLNSLAWAAYAGGMTITAGFVAIRAASTVASLSVMGASRVEGLNKMLLDNSPEDLRRLNRQQLAKMGLGGNDIDLFLRNPWFSPRHRTVLVEELAGMEKTKNRQKFITLATTVESEQDAFFFQRIAQLMRGYHETQSPIQEIDLIGGLAVGYAANDALVVPLVVDQGQWSAEAVVLTKALDEGAPQGKKKQLWVTGKLSPRLVEELQARRWLISTGFAHDSAPVSKFHRTPTAAFDENFRYGVGLQYDWSENVTVGAAYEVLDLGDAEIVNLRRPTGTLQGDYPENLVYFAALNVVWKF